VELERKGYPDDTCESEYAYGRGGRKVGREEAADEPRAISREGEAGALPFASRLPCERSPHAEEVGGEGDVGHCADEGSCDRGRPVGLHEGKGKTERERNTEPGLFHSGVECCAIAE
jgi:hypothetical protein